MANSYIIILAAVLPALVLLYYIWRRDKYQHEPVQMLLLGALYGVLATGIAATLEELLVFIGLAPQSPTTIIGCIWDAFAGVAIVEEGVKLFFLWLLLRRNKYYDELMDGIVYAVAVGMGFAGTENIIYLISNIDSWQSIAFGRAIFSVPGHYMFAVAMGYYYSLNHFTYQSKLAKLRVILIPTLLHGIFDSLLMISNVSPQISGLIMLFFIIFCLRLPKMAKRRINKLLEEDKKRAEEANWNIKLIFK